MHKEDLYRIIGISEGQDYGWMKSREFENLICSELKKHGKIKRQVVVPNRGDGRRGRIDVVFKPYQFEYAIEIDRMQPRTKSIFKVVHYNDKQSFVITRSPYSIIEI